MRNSICLLVIASCVLKPNIAAAEPVHLNGAAIKATLPGSVLKLDTPLGTVVPIKFDDDGLMSGDAGQLASYLGSQKDRGRYWLTEDRICYKWFRWFSGEQHCLAIQRDGQRIFWRRDDGETGTATLEEPKAEAPKALARVAPAKPAKPVKRYVAQREPQRQPREPQKLAHQIPPSPAPVAFAEEPVLVKLPTLAVRPPKRAVLFADELARSATANTLQSSKDGTPR